MKKILSIVFIVFLIFRIIAFAAEITAGYEAIDRADVTGTGVTMTTKDSTATGTGTITTVEIWAATELAGCKVGTFSAVGNDLTARDSETVNNGNGAGVVLAGSKQTFTVDIDVVLGDTIGIYFSGGTLERAWDGGVDYWYKDGDQMACSSETFSVGNNILSLKGIGATTPTFALEKFNAVVCTKWNEIAILEWNATSIP